MREFLGSTIKQRGGEVRLNFRVNSISQNKEQCSQKSEGGIVLEGRLCNICCPLHQSDHLQSLALSQKRLVNERVFMGNLAMVTLLYEECSWKTRGFTGEFVSLCLDLPVINCFDVSKLNCKGELQPQGLAAAIHYVARTMILYAAQAD
jgi:hypothetical protein